MKWFNWYQKHYGTGIMPIVYLIGLPIFFFLLGWGIESYYPGMWWIGLALFLFIVFIFWTQRNTK